MKMEDENLVQSLETIEDKIYDIFVNCTQAEYISTFELTIDEDHWTLLLDINQQEAPLSLSCQGTEKEFLCFLTKELKSRQLDKTKYWTLELQDAGNGNQFIILDK